MFLILTLYILTTTMYVLTVTIYDMAGNVTEKKVNFSVNKNGATFKFKPIYEEAL